MTTASKTSIVATLGPASSDAAVLESLVRQGVSVLRLNFSHGTFETHAQTLAHISRIRKSLPYEIAVMGDLCGPKIRLGQVEPQTVLAQNAEVMLSAGTAVGTAAQLFTDFEPLVRDVQPGQRILIDDGRLLLQALEKTAAGIRCRVAVGGPVSSRKGINLPDTRLAIQAITEKDWQYADWAAENQLDYLALSFVQRADEIVRLKAYLASKGSGIRVISKIEKPLAVENIEAIIRASDAVLIARGDMGVEMDLAQVPLVQKKITALCRRLAKPVIVATQVLQSMIDNASPTRAEAADIANAVMDGADAVMLSGETAVGRYPLAAAAALSHICRTTEQFLEAASSVRAPMETPPEQIEKAAIARAVAQMLDEVKCACIVVWTKTGQMAHLLSKAHPDVPIVSLSANRLLARQLALCRGVVSIYQPAVSAYEEWIGLVHRLLLAGSWAAAGDKVLLIPPLELLTAQTSGALILHTLAK
ncbi:MAG TPA: pyruvate kinase [Anaerohalosphaeraceae bacterium]|nr:pyruvate kinase [Anaerohalosphaeraceae bacterium]